VSDSSAPIVLEKLRAFLSTDTRRNLFLCYVFSKTSPSGISQSTSTPLSTVDMITNNLRLMELLKESEGSERSKNYYEVNMETWLTENLNAMGMHFVKEIQKKKILNIFADKEFLALSFILTDPDFAMSLYKEPLKMGDDLIVFKLMKILKRASITSDLPSYILISVLIFPSFRQLKDNIFSEKGLKETINLINEEATKYPFLGKALRDVDEETFKRYDEKRAELTALMEQLIEQELQVRSTEKVKKKLEVEEEAEEEEETEEAEEPEEKPAKVKHKAKTTEKAKVKTKRRKSAAKSK